ncbi:DUF418 domain-containing protein [Nocardiopsis gilva YIM 90087]|uniref:DUF418 domain-containing protein n=1 Tax=Nocardiopsis gilva YIM 90087 TaxID=1235441 RepID=A0A223S5J1_9ACTN|nr:DUF418 domain-containing protein [Nocardiopsis gilva]ASU83381.1 DUF418 domain-containing protein [Nocardiopsis gilva YIM 90087]
MESTRTQTAEASPAPPGTRLPLLDVLRGAAIIGTLGTNVWIFASLGSEAALLSGGGEFGTLGDALSDPSPGTVVSGVFRWLANGKFLTMLTVLFGVGLAIQFRSAAKRGSRWPGTYKWRALFLFAEGLVHFTLVFAYDVLMGYAVTSLVVAWLLSRSERARSIALWTGAVVHVLAMSLATAALVYATSAFDGPDTGSAEAPSVDPDAVRLFAEGSYLEQVSWRLDNFFGVLRLEPVITFTMMVFLFLLGVRLFRAGAFGDDATGRRLRVRLMAWGLGIGVPFNVVTALSGPEFFLIDRYLAAPVVGVGLLGLIGWLLDHVRGTGPVVTGLSSLGRTSLSGYVLQNLLAMLACYGIGLGLAAKLSGSGPWWVIGLWAAISLILMTGSTLWLRRFDHGPFEALQKWTLSKIPDRHPTISA